MQLGFNNCCNLGLLSFPIKSLPYLKLSMNTFHPKTLTCDNKKRFLKLFYLLIPILHMSNENSAFVRPCKTTTWFSDFWSNTDKSEVGWYFFFLLLQQIIIWLHCVITKPNSSNVCLITLKILIVLLQWCNIDHIEQWTVNFCICCLQKHFLCWILYQTKQQRLQTDLILAMKINCERV